MLTAEDKVKIEETMKKMDGHFQKGPTKKYSNDDFRILYSLAHTLYEGGDFKESKGVFERLASCEPFAPKNWMGLGACWQMDKKHQEALQAWAMASLLDNNNPTPHFHAAECYLALGNALEGRKAIEACRNRLSENDLSLQAKLEKLETSYAQEEKGA